MCLQFLNQSSRPSLSCPLCSHALSSRNFSDYKPNYGMIDVLKELEISIALPLAASLQPVAPATPSPNRHTHSPPQAQNVYMPGNLTDLLPVAGGTSSGEATVASTCELEVLPSAGTDALTHLWPRVQARYWINAKVLLGSHGRILGHEHC
jgi:hypothetical protein